MGGEAGGRSHCTDSLTWSGRAAEVGGGQAEELVLVFPGWCGILGSSLGSLCGCCVTANGKTSSIAKMLVPAGMSASWDGRSWGGVGAIASEDAQPSGGGQ